MEYNFDTDGDGTVDQTGLDSNGDGRIERWLIDTSGDMVADQIAADLDGDGLADTWNIDQDQDGYVERVFTDSTADGTPDGYTDIPESGPLAIVTSPGEWDTSPETDTSDTSDGPSLSETVESIMERAERETDPAVRRQLTDLANKLIQTNNDMINVWLR